MPAQAAGRPHRLRPYQPLNECELEPVAPDGSSSEHQRSLSAMACSRIGTRSARAADRVITSARRSRKTPTGTGEEPDAHRCTLRSLTLSAAANGDCQRSPYNDAPTCLMMGVGSVTFVLVLVDGGVIADLGDPLLH
jgi:hypothetical protein